ncbi:AAA family ATPase [Candidatus Pacearchaeota archaeon]|nr:AAA family ATPase [Candidatus Pacearchaeota archaeon]
MAKTIGIVAIKGGVGKTTISASLASDLANNYSKKVLLVDTNYSAPNLGLHMDIISPDKTIHHVLDNKIKIQNAIHKKFSVDVIPGDYVYNKKLNYGKLKEAIGKIKNNYDFIILDSSPSLNEEMLSTMLASDALFVVSTPDYPTLSCTLKAAKLAKQRGRPIAGIIINKIRDPKYELTLDEMEESLNIPVMAMIPDDKYATKSVFTRIPISIYKNNSSFAKEINRLGAALTLSKEQSSFWRKFFSLSFRKEEVNRDILRESFYTGIFKELHVN